MKKIKIGYKKIDGVVFGVYLQGKRLILETHPNNNPLDIFKELKFTTLDCMKTNFGDYLKSINKDSK